jgi:hypothetical protein
VPADFSTTFDDTVTEADAKNIPESNPTLILARLDKYKAALEKVMEWNDREKELLNMTMRDAYTQKPLDPVEKKLNIKEWSIIMNMDMLRF